VIIANGSQPEFDFDDQAPAKPAARSAAVTQAQTAATPVVAAPAAVAIEPQAVHESPVALQATAPVAPAPAVESSGSPVVAASVVDAQAEPVVAASPAEARVVTPEILKSDTVESFSMVESPAPAEAAAPVQAAPEAPAPAASPAPVAAVAATEPPKPAPVRPAVGNTGSLFFTADADTPSSVTRHLFEPVPVAAQPAAAAEKSEEHDLPLLADNDEADDEENKQGSERSA
jgi:ribonuclease E